MKHTFLLLTALLLGPLANLHATEKTKPNIVVILAADLGYADFSCQGARDVKTPNIDSLAVNGVRCTAGYVTAPQCSPSRAGLTSGCYQQRFGHEGNPDFPLTLMSGSKTIADHLKAAGYATSHYGKWHIGFEDKEAAPKEMVVKGDWVAPAQHGFDGSLDMRITPRLWKRAVRSKAAFAFRSSCSGKGGCRQARPTTGLSLPTLLGLGRIRKVWHPIT